MSEARPPAAGNIPEYTVSEISGAVKRTLEGAFGRVRVRGEITELKRYTSGHIYFSLKDEGGKIAGAGALLARIEALRVRLAAEGLFDAARKQALPLLPDVVGVITSERGAVI